MKKLGFEPSQSDPCLFIHKHEKIMVLNYCDDQIWLSPDNSLIEKYVGQLASLGCDLTMEPKGNMFGFLGIEFEHVGTTIKLTQKALIQKVLNCTGMQNASPVPTPALKEPLGSDPNGALLMKIGAILQFVACCSASAPTLALRLNLQSIKHVASPMLPRSPMPKLSSTSCAILWALLTRELSLPLHTPESMLPKMHIFHMFHAFPHSAFQAQQLQLGGDCAMHKSHCICDSLPVWD